MTLLLRISGFLLLAFLLHTCSIWYTIEYEVSNYTQEPLLIFSRTMFSETADTNRISPNTTLKILIDHDRGGAYTASVMENLEHTPFTQLAIVTISGKRYNKDALDLNNWVKHYPEKKFEDGRISFAKSNHPVQHRQGIQ